MLGRHKAVLGAMTLGLVLAAAKPAHALQESTRGPFYIQGLVPAFSFYGGGGGYGGAWAPDVEFGYHFSGRHDGFVLGGRQGFDVGTCAMGATVARLGYDIAIPIKDGRFELTIAPYGVVGLNYFFPCGGGGSVEAGFRFGAGVEAKFFFLKGLYAVVRPVETDGAQLVDAGYVWFRFSMGAGIGYAF